MRGPDDRIVKMRFASMEAPGVMLPELLREAIIQVPSGKRLQVWLGDHVILQYWPTPDQDTVHGADPHHSAEPSAQNKTTACYTSPIDQSSHQPYSPAERSNVWTLDLHLELARKNLSQVISDMKSSPDDAAKNEIADLERSLSVLTEKQTALWLDNPQLLGGMPLCNASAKHTKK